MCQRCAKGRGLEADTGHSKMTAFDPSRLVCRRPADRLASARVLRCNCATADPPRIYLRDRAPALIRVFVAAVSVAPGRNSRNSPFDERLGPPDSQSSPIASRTTPPP